MPRRIWILWLQGWDDAPLVVRRCRESWHHHNPDWDVVSLDESTIDHHLEPGFMAAIANLAPAQRSDAVRLALLARHGGVWADATLGCRHPLDTWLPDVMGAGFFAFGGGAPDRLCEAWFMAAQPTNVLVTRWADEFVAYARTVNGESPNRLQRAITHRLWLVTHRTRLGTRPYMWPVARRLLKTNAYFATNYVFNRLVTRDPACRRVWDALPRRPPASSHPDPSGYYEQPATPDVRSAVDATTRPVVKLTWKEPAEIDGAETRLGYASRTLCGDHPGPEPDI